MVNVIVKLPGFLLNMNCRGVPHSSRGAATTCRGGAGGCPGATAGCRGGARGAAAGCRGGAGGCRGAAAACRGDANGTWQVVQVEVLQPLARHHLEARPCTRAAAGYSVTLKQHNVIDLPLNNTLI